jgi:hypothetical protein
VAGLSAERLWHQPESQRARESGAKWLIGLLQLLDLMGNDLDELLKLLELRGDDGQQLLEQCEVLLLKELYLLKLLGHDLQQLRDLLSRRLAAESRADVGSVAPGILCHRINGWRSDSKPGTCELTHLTSSVTVDRTFFVRQPERCHVVVFAVMRVR